MCKIGDPSHSYEFVLRLLALIHISNLAAAAGDGTSRSRHEIASTGRVLTAKLLGLLSLSLRHPSQDGGPPPGRRQSAEHSCQLPPDCWRPTTANGVK